MGKVLSYGMVGGGPDAFIGDAHRRSIALDGRAKIVAGAFSRKREKSMQMAEMTVMCRWRKQKESGKTELILQW